MRTRYGGAALALVLAAVLISGCPPRTQPQDGRVAGSQEGGPSEMTITYTDDGFTVDPASIPQGDVRARLVNNSSRDVRFQYVGQQSWTLRRGQTATTMIRNPEPGVYRVEPPSRQQVAGSAERSTTVDVGMTEFRFTLSRTTIPPGDAVFNVRNNGNAVHAFEIEGQGIEERTRNLQPGESQTLRVANLRPGRYEIYCPVGNHAERGMRTTLTVQEGGGQ